MWGESYTYHLRLDGAAKFWYDHKLELIKLEYNLHVFDKNYFDLREKYELWHTTSYAVTFSVVINFASFATARFESMQISW